MPIEKGSQEFDPETGLVGVVTGSRVSHALTAAAPAKSLSSAPRLFNLPAAKLHTLLTLQLEGGLQVERDQADVLPLPGAAADLRHFGG